MNIQVRKAIKADCTAIMQLINELAVYEKAAEKVTVDFNHFVDSGFGKIPVWWAFVACNNENTIVGVALYYIRYSTWEGQRMYLEDLIITDKMRGQGIGKLMFDKLFEECKEQKFCGINWQVLDWNEPAINFYKKLGNVNFDAEWINCSISF